MKEAEAGKIAFVMELCDDYVAELVEDVKHDWTKFLVRNDVSLDASYARTRILDGDECMAWVGSSATVLNFQKNSSYLDP